MLITLALVVPMLVLIALDAYLHRRADAPKSDA